jgi:sugar lactone lactonase YvrE
MGGPFGAAAAMRIAGRRSLLSVRADPERRYDVSETRVLVDGLGFPESTRWRDGRVWLCNWGGGEVLAVSPDGRREVMARLAAPTLPFSIDWLPDGRLLVIDGRQQLLLCQQPDGSLTAIADLTGFGPAPFNELVVDGAGNAYVNGGPGIVVCVGRDGGVREVADVAKEGALSGRRVWAGLEHAPDGICADADGAVWVASVPGRHCVRVREGGQVLDTVAVDRGCFACMLGGDDGRTLFIAAAQWRGMETAMSEGPGTTGRLLAAPDQPAAHAGRP